MVIRIKNNRFTPLPQMDWGEIREAKFRCEKECACFSLVLGGCSLGLLSSLQCKEFKVVPSKGRVANIPHRIVRHRGRM